MAQKYKNDLSTFNNALLFVLLYSVENFSSSLERIYRIWERFYKLSLQYTARIKESIVLKNIA